MVVRLPPWTIQAGLLELISEKPHSKNWFFDRITKTQTTSMIGFKSRPITMYSKSSVGRKNLNQVFQSFFDNILPNYSDKEYYYDIYLPLTGHHYDIWTPAKAAFVNEERVKLTEIRKPEYKAIKVKDINQIDFDQAVLDKLKTTYVIGDIVDVTLENVFDGPILMAKSKK